MPQALNEHIDLLLAAVLRDGSRAAMPAAPMWDVFVESAVLHGVLPLVWDAAVSARWDRELLDRMRPAVAADAAIGLVNDRELKRTLAGLRAARVRPIVFKGAHLAYTVYESPERRPRVDTDILVSVDEYDTTCRALASLGYEPVPHVSGEVAFGQAQFGRIDDAGAQHTVDVHRRIANPQAFADRVTYSELAAEATAIDRLGRTIVGPSLRFALILACLHRTAHHGSCRRLIWLYDIHLIATALGRSEWDLVCGFAARKRLSPVILAGLRDASSALGTPLPSEVVAALSADCDEVDRDVLQFLVGQPAQIRVAASDWCRLRSWRDRVTYLREHLFPSPDYIRHRYGVSSRAALPFLYTHRIVTGARKWF